MTVEDFYRRSKTKFIKKILPIVRNRDLAEDLVQDAVVKALERYHLYDPSRAKEETWFTCILFSTLWNWKRSEKRSLEIDSRSFEDLEQFLTPFEDDPFDRNIDLCFVKNPLHRIIGALHFKSGYSAEEISVLLGQTPTNVYKVVQRLRKVL